MCIRDRFDPDANITRAEFAAICARFDDSGVDGITTFTDTVGHWAEDEISRAAALGWIQGYSDGTFRPNQYITRAQAVTMINRVLCQMCIRDRFVTRNGKAMSRTQVTAEIQSLCRDARVDEAKGNPRCLRKLYLATRTDIERSVRLLAEQAYERVLDAEQLAAGWGEGVNCR